MGVVTDVVCMLLRSLAGVVLLDLSDCWLRSVAVVVTLAYWLARVRELLCLAYIAE